MSHELGRALHHREEALDLLATEHYGQLRAALRFEGEAAGLADAAAFRALVDAQEKRDWVVHSKKPVRGPRQVLEYISRYTHRVAIANRRILDVAADGAGRFEY